MRGSPGARDGGRRSRDETGRRPRSWPEVKPDLEQLFGIELPQGLLGLGEPIDDAQSAARLLREMLQRRLLPIRTKIAGERLADLLDIHRNTMSKVFQSLAEEGYLQRRRGRSPVVAAHTNVLPKRHTKRVSHTALAVEHRLEIRTQTVRNERRRVAQVAAGRRAKVAERLTLELVDEVVVHSRIRELREPGGSWVPAIAETAYFPALRAPQIADAIEEPARVHSVHEFFRQMGIEPVTGAYEVRVGTLPEPFHEPWAKAAKLSSDVVARLPFLRFESTTHGHVGAIEFSVAYLAKDIFSLATTDVTLEIDSSAVREAARKLASGRTDRALEPRSSGQREGRRPARRRTVR